MLNPAPSIWYRKALRMARPARRMFCGVLTAQRSMYVTPSSPARTSLMRMGCPSRAALRPGGDVVDIMPSTVVGAIWPPVMP